MRRARIAGSAAVAALLALAGYPCSLDAAVLIKTFQFGVCVTGAKHPDGCKNVDADAHVVVSDDAMEELEGKIGQGASILAAPDKGTAPPPTGQERHHHHQDQNAQ